MEKFQSKDKSDKSDGRNGGMSNALKFLLLAAGCGLVILLITVAVMTAKKGEDDTNSNLDQYSAMAAEYEELDLKVYDGSTVMGSAIKDLINEYAGSDYLSIEVHNGKDSTTDYVCSISEIVNNIVTIGEASQAKISINPMENHYISDSGTFLCEVLYDKNGVVACLRFSQQ